jgi:hypothetical protein
LYDILLKLEVKNEAYVIWRIDLDDWHDVDLHWSSPTYIELDTVTGRTVFYAAQMANMQRTGIVTDTGQSVNAIIELDFYASIDGSGASIGRFVVTVAQFLKYKESREPTNWTTQPDAQLASLFTVANSVKKLQRWQ